MKLHPGGRQSFVAPSGLRSFGLLLLIAAFLPGSVFAVPSPRADPIFGFISDWFGGSKSKTAETSTPPPVQVQTTPPPPAKPLEELPAKTDPSYSIQDIIPVTARPPTPEDNVIYPNMMSARNSGSVMITGLIEYFSDEYRKASISIHFKVEDIGRCVQWIAKARNSIAESDILFNTGSNRLMWATKFAFDRNPTTFDDRGYAWARGVGFFSDRYCRTMIGVQQLANSGVLERPAFVSFQQADIRGDQGRASIYLQTLRLPPLFYTMIIA